MKRYLIPFFLVTLAWTSFTIANDRLTGATFASRSEVIAKHGMAATSQPLATQIAIDILKQGGNAIDAAIAANAALGLMEPTGNGIGGDLFAIVWDGKTQRLHGLNASGRSPKSLTLAEFRKRTWRGFQSLVRSQSPCQAVSMAGSLFTRSLVSFP